MNYNSLAHELMVRLSVMILLAVCVPAMANMSANAQPRTIVVLGDSLTAGYGLEPGQGFPHQLSNLIDDNEFEFVDAGVSGDTSTGGLARLDWSVPEGTSAVIVELGANDALRAIPPKVTADNLEKIITRLQARDIVVMLVGMKAPPNMGREYAEEFDAIYPALAQKYALVFYPFFLDGVVAVPELNQADAIHPTAEGIKIIANRIAPTIRELLAVLKNK